MSIRSTAICNALATVLRILDTGVSCIKCVTYTVYSSICLRLGRSTCNSRCGTGTVADKVSFVVQISGIGRMSLTCTFTSSNTKTGGARHVSSSSASAQQWIRGNWCATSVPARKTLWPCGVKVKGCPSIVTDRSCRSCRTRATLVLRCT
eukprot:578997-Amphidinium_carterae.2